MKTLEVAHHKFQKRLLRITWRDKVRNEDIRKKTGNRVGCLKLRLRGYKRKPGQLWKNWVDFIKRNLKNMDLTWEQADVLANDKAEWRRRVANTDIWMRDEH